MVVLNMDHIHRQMEISQLADVLVLVHVDRTTQTPTLLVQWTNYVRCTAVWAHLIVYACWNFHLCTTCIQRVLTFNTFFKSSSMCWLSSINSEQILMRIKMSGRMRSAMLHKNIIMQHLMSRAILNSSQVDLWTNFQKLQQAIFFLSWN